MPSSPSTGRGQLEGHFRALGAADPVLLHQFDALGPARQLVQPGQQFRREIGDLQEPLREEFLFDQGAGEPAAAVDHLLVGEHGVVHRVPVHRRGPPLDQPGLPEIQEESSAAGRNIRDRRWRIRATSRATGPCVSARRASPRYWRRSRWRGRSCAGARRFPPAGRTRPSPSGAARQSLLPACSAPPRRPACSSAHAPYGFCRRGTGTFQEHNISAGRRLGTSSALKQAACSQAACQCGSAVAKS